ncbi:MAG: dihydrodipicolinate synthase family protein, partial [Parvibaculaceae bacterium]
MTPQGLWIPLITPFRDGELDEASLQRLAAHYAALPVDGLILGATTGEGLSLDDEEIDRLVLVIRAALAAARRQMPLYLGLSGGATVKVVKALHRTQMLPLDGYLIACPYYVRPSQAGLFRHFSTLAENTSRPILIYNIPYRTGVNLGNETMLRLAETPNIVGVKDCAADAAQSFDLLRQRPEGFSVLTGEDALFYTALTQGADG